MDNKKISLTESEQANSNINSNDTTQELFRELLNTFDGLNHVLRISKLILLV